MRLRRSPSLDTDDDRTARAHFIVRRDMPAVGRATQSLAQFCIPDRIPAKLKPSPHQVTLFQAQRESGGLLGPDCCMGAVPSMGAFLAPMSDLSSLRRTSIHLKSRPPPVRHFVHAMDLTEAPSDLDGLTSTNMLDVR
jgi:hypothetical protein